MTKFVASRAFALPALLLGGLSLSACSYQANGHGSRYAAANCDTYSAQHCTGYGAEQGIYSGHSAGKSRYGTVQNTVNYDQYAYAPQYPALRNIPVAPPTNYLQPSYEQPSYQAPSYASYSAEVADCPIGTTAQSDGTCLQGSSMSYSSPAVTTPSYSGGYMVGGTTENCPAGTSAQSDGTCLEGASSSLSYSSSSYSLPSYSSSSNVIAPPISEYDWGSKDTTWGSAAYVSPGTRTVDNPNSYQPASVPTTGSSYWPVRK